MIPGFPLHVLMESVNEGPPFGGLSAMQPDMSHLADGES